MITTVIANGKDEYTFVETIKERSNTGAKDVSGIVSDIINNVKVNGDKAVYDYTLKFDGKAPEKERLKFPPMKLTGSLSLAMKSIWKLSEKPRRISRISTNVRFSSRG